MERVRPGCDLAPGRDTKSQDAQVAKALQNGRFAPPALTPSLPAIQLPHPARTLASASTQDTGLAHAISTSLNACGDAYGFLDTSAHRKLPLSALRNRLPGLL